MTKFLRHIKPGDLITEDALNDAGACWRDRMKFRDEWPDGVILRRKSLLRAAELRLDIEWFSREVGLPTYELPALLRQLRGGSVLGGKGVRARQNKYREALVLYIWKHIKDR